MPALILHIAAEPIQILTITDGNGRVFTGIRVLRAHPSLRNPRVLIIMVVLGQVRQVLFGETPLLPIQIILKAIYRQTEAILPGIIIIMMLMVLQRTRLAGGFGGPNMRNSDI